LASVGSLSHDDVFTASQTPDMENELDSRQDTMAQWSSQEDILKLKYSSLFNSDSDILESIQTNHRKPEDHNKFGSKMSDASGMKDSTMCENEMSMSLDSLLKEVCESDKHLSLGSSFKTFGKSVDSTHTTPEKRQSAMFYENNPHRISCSESLGAADNTSATKQNIPPVPKPRASKQKTVSDSSRESLSPKKYKKKSKNVSDSVLETNIDQFELSSPMSDDTDARSYGKWVAVKKFFF
jgi:hypothetical protein